VAEKQQIRAIKGVRDILPPASAAWNRVEQAAREVFASFGYGEIRLPILEPTELFARAVGGEADIVNKEMYTLQEQMLLTDPKFVAGWQKLREIAIAHDPSIASMNQDTRRSVLEHERNWVLAAHTSIAWSIQESIENSISMRPEATASVCRAYIEHGMHTLPGDVKLYYIGPMFRRERPQKGRYRQFYQIGAEVLGQSDAPGIDAELIEMLMAFFGRVELSGITLDLNSIGCSECRPKYVEVLRAALVKVKDKLGADSQRRIETNPLRVLDSKIPEEQPIIETLPRISDHLCESCKTHFAEVRRQLDLRGIAYNLNWRLVRGLDYYMRTTFEITAPGLGSQNAVCGGGRYDGLVELLGGPPTKGIGFAIGMDRLMLSLESLRKDATVAGTGTEIRATVGNGMVTAESAHKDVAVPATGVGLKATVGSVWVSTEMVVFIVWMGAAAQPVGIQLAQKLRAAGLKVELPPEEFKFKKALGLADKLGAKYAVLIGENEIAAGKFTLKRLADAVQTSVTEAELLAELKKA
jgi:histidyl-tRNA synthetase